MITAAPPEIDAPDLSPPDLSPPMAVLPEWIDHSGHMNRAFYGVLFDKGSSHVFRRIGFGPAYRAQYQRTTFAGEFWVRYFSELRLGDRVRCSFRLLDVGPKSFHFAQELLRGDGRLVATSEKISLNIDTNGPRVAPYLPEILARLQALQKEQAQLPRPDWVGRKMGLR
ncbi:thioesterase family protein [Pseudooceanicola sp.]|uniref:thioesterase family protein n=1 Tax=Pseudooceanicola sp. TaxID=1914328 RepID=UPI0026219EFE|nr:thioesterase family protein [Pseudooceanicola sp.]MDF1855647.1 thioesterase family protein [Pseudooceanicola sp.]